MASWWHNDMPVETARRVLGQDHYDYAVAQGPCFCAAGARGAWMANTPESYGAYKTAERVAAGCVA